MDPNRLTHKSQEALHDAQTKALRFGHTEVDSEHLLQALLDQPEGLAPRLLEAAGGDTSRLRADLEAELALRPGADLAGDVPPFAAKRGMAAVIARELQGDSRHHRCR